MFDFYLNTSISKAELPSIFSRVPMYITLAFLLGIPALILSPCNFIKKLQNKRRVLLRQKIIAGAILMLGSLSIYLSYNIGFLRFSNVSKLESPVNYKGGIFNGEVKVLINASGTILGIITDNEKPPYYILITEKFIIKSTPKSTINQ